MPPLVTRRQALGALGAAFAAPAEPDPWAQLPEILERIQPPAFPARDFAIAPHGGRPDGKTDCTDAFRKAIAECAAAGGGRVVVPEGLWRAGAIPLKSNVNLYLSRGAVIRFSRDPEHLLPAVFTRWEGVECMGCSPFIYAFGQRNIPLIGEGTIDGAADCEHWWPWKGSPVCGWKKGDQTSKQHVSRHVEGLTLRDVTINGNPA